MAAASRWGDQLVGRSAGACNWNRSSCNWPIGGPENQDYFVILFTTEFMGLSAPIDLSSP